MSHSTSNKTTPSSAISRILNATLNFATGPFFAPVGFSAAGMFAGGYLAFDYGFPLVSAIIFGAIAGLTIWLLIIVVGWLS